MTIAIPLTTTTTCTTAATWMMTVSSKGEHQQPPHTFCQGMTDRQSSCHKNGIQFFFFFIPSPYISSFLLPPFLSSCSTSIHPHHLLLPFLLLSYTLVQTRLQMPSKLLEYHEVNFLNSKFPRTSNSVFFYPTNCHIKFL